MKQEETEAAKSLRGVLKKPEIRQNWRKWQPRGKILPLLTLFPSLSKFLPIFFCSHFDLTISCLSFYLLSFDLQGRCKEWLNCYFSFVFWVLFCFYCFVFLVWFFLGGSFFFLFFFFLRCSAFFRLASLITVGHEYLFEYFLLRIHVQMFLDYCNCVRLRESRKWNAKSHSLSNIRTQRQTFNKLTQTYSDQVQSPEQVFSETTLFPNDLMTVED